MVLISNSYLLNNQNTPDRYIKSFPEYIFIDDIPI